MHENSCGHQKAEVYFVRRVAVEELTCGWHEDSETLKFIKQWATADEDDDVRRSAVQELKKWWGGEVK